MYTTSDAHLCHLSFPSPICALLEADRLDQREGEGEKEADRDLPELLHTR
jgi:hypothetical protein